MRTSIKKGVGFGLTSGVITTLGLMTGLNSSTGSTTVIIGGILVIAVADAMSDALGVHVSEELEHQHTTREIWEATIATLVSKLVVALTFIVPVLIFHLALAIKISLMWGFSLIAISSYYIAKKQNGDAKKIITEHLLIAILVIVVTNYIGGWVSTFK